MKFSAENPRLRKAAKRYLQPADRKIKINFRHKTSRLDLTKLSRPVCENQIVLSAWKSRICYPTYFSTFVFAKGRQNQIS